MKKTLLILTILFSSCYSLQKAKKDLLKIEIKHPELIPEKCIEKYPVTEKVVEKTKFIKGETITKTDTLTIDCDEIVKDTTKENKLKIKYLNKFRIDTVYKEVIVEKEVTAKIDLLNIKLNKEKYKTTKLEEKIKKEKKYKYYFFSLIGLLGLGLFFKFR